jgi:hypothetical protein
MTMADVTVHMSADRIVDWSPVNDVALSMKFR